MLYKRCLNLSGEYMHPIKPDTLQVQQYGAIDPQYQRRSTDDPAT